MTAPIKAQRQAHYGICPLCEKAFPRQQLRDPVQAEAPFARVAIVQAIREEFPAWTEGDGACVCCWGSFRSVARVSRYLQQFKSARRP
jgi:hypothetical protein